MSKKKTKLYDVPAVQSFPTHPGIYKRDPSDRRLYIWYNIASALIETDGTLRMPAAGCYRSATEDIYNHWVGVARVTSDQSEYEELVQAIEKRGPVAAPH